MRWLVSTASYRRNSQPRIAYFATFIDSLIARLNRLGVVTLFKVNSYTRMLYKHVAGHRFNGDY